MRAVAVARVAAAVVRVVVAVRGWRRSQEVAAVDDVLVFHGAAPHRLRSGPNGFVLAQIGFVLAQNEMTPRKVYKNEMKVMLMVKTLCTT